MKNHHVFTYLGMIGAVALAALAIVIATPETATARLSCGTTCDCDGPTLFTLMVWGSGDTCTEAFNDGLAQSRALQSCIDGVCSEFVIIDTPCWFDGTHYMVDLHTDYKCYQCSSSACPAPYPDVDLE